MTSTTGHDFHGVDRHLIGGYYDNFTSGAVDYAPPPTNGFATTYPFVEKVFINGLLRKPCRN